jgi:hypothetical protein
MFNQNPIKNARLTNHYQRNFIDFRPNLFLNPKTKNSMKKALKKIWLVIYYIIALLPIFFLGYMLGLKLI